MFFFFNFFQTWSNHSENKESININVLKSSVDKILISLCLVVNFIGSSQINEIFGPVLAFYTIRPVTTLTGEQNQYWSMKTKISAR